MKTIAPDRATGLKSLPTALRDLPESELVRIAYGSASEAPLVRRQAERELRRRVEVAA